MELLILIFPLLSFSTFQFLGFIKNVKILYSLHTIFIFSSFIISLFIFFKLLNIDSDIPIYFYTIAKSDYLLLDWSLRIDLFVSGLMLIVTLVSFICTIYLISFYKEDKINLKIIGKASLSLFGTLTLISSNDLIQLFSGWQIIIFSSYLIVKDLDKRSIIQDNSQVFLCNRLSDLGFFLSLFFIFSFSNSIDFDVIFESKNIVQKNQLILFDTKFTIYEVILFLLFVSFLLRCRQFFIKNSSYSYLNINIPSLTLIYSAVFLPTGIFFILRFLPLTQKDSEFLNLIMLLGLIFLIIFTFLSFNSKNLKSLIIYVASSQFSLIIFVIGHKVYNGAFFYLLTSTLSLTLISLSLGIIILKLRDEQKINKMGALLIKTPSTFLFTLIGIISFLGIPYFSGFYSKKLILTSPLLFNENFYFYSMIIFFCYTFFMSYLLSKIVLIVFLCQNNCNIHLYNKINEKTFFSKFSLFLLATCLIFCGWFLKDLFYGSNAENLWNLVLNSNSEFYLRHENKIYDFFIEKTNIICLLGILLSIFNYVIIPKIGNNIKIKHSKIFKYYSTYLTSNN